MFKWIKERRRLAKRRSDVKRSFGAVIRNGKPVIDNQLGTVSQYTFDQNGKHFCLTEYLYPRYGEAHVIEVCKGECLDDDPWLGVWTRYKDSRVCMDLVRTFEDGDWVDALKAHAGIA